MVLREKLLDVPRRGSSGAGLEQPAAVHQRHDRQHLRARPELEDREQVGEVVAEHVAGDRDRVLAGAGALEREPRRVGDIEDLDLDAVGVELLERGPDLAQQLGIVGPRRVEPEDGGRCCFTRARYGKPNPILNGGVLGLTHPPDVASLDLVLDQRVAGSADHPDHARSVDLERLVVRPVLLGGLGHQPDVGRAPHLRGVERAVAPAIVDRLGVQRSI